MHEWVWFGYCVYYGLKANSLVILCNSISCKRTELTNECFVIQIMLRKNWNISTTYSSLQPVAMPPVQKNSVVLKKQATKVWRHLGHNLDGAIAKCLLCKYNPAKGDAHKSSLVNKYSFSQVQPWSSRFAKDPPKPWETTCRHITRRSSRTWWRRSRRSSRPPTNCKTKSFQLLSDELSSVDQLGWGKHHETQFPLLAKLKVVFPVPAASSKSERVFSVAGSVVTPKTANLNPEKVEDLVVVKCNLRLLKSMGLIRK